MKSLKVQVPKAMASQSSAEPKPGGLWPTQSQSLERCSMCGKNMPSGKSVYVCDNDCGVIFCSVTCLSKDDHECGRDSEDEDAIIEDR